MEHPYYRQEGRDFPALLERLAPYMPDRTAPNHPPGARFTHAQATAYHDRVLASLAVQGAPAWSSTCLFAPPSSIHSGTCSSTSRPSPHRSGSGTLAAHLG